MKRKIKNFKKLLLFGIVFMLIGCEVNEQFIEKSNEAYTVKKISFKDFKSKVAIFDKFKKIAPSTESSNSERVVYDENYGLYYDTNNIVLVEKEGYKSYTIPLINQENENVLKNLVIYEKTGKPVKVKMMNYEVTEQEILKIKNGEYVNLETKTTSQSLATNSSSSYSWYDDSGCLVTATTTIIAGTPCQGDGHVFGEPCSHEGTSLAATPTRIVIKYTYAFCPPDLWSGGGGDNSGGSPGPGGGGSGGGSSSSTGSSNNAPAESESNEDIITTPVIPGLDGNIPEKTPCDELKTNSNDADFKGRMQALKTNINGTKEKTFGIYNGKYVSATYPNPSCGVILEGNEQESGTVPYHTSLKAIAHNHLKNAIYNHIGTFAPNDIVQLNNIAIMAEQQQSPVTQEEFASYVICDEGIYAIKITDINKLYNFALKYGTDDVFFLEINEYYKKKNISHGKEKQLQNIGFLKLLKDYDIGIEYYESYNNFENWKKLELNEDETYINETPC